MKIRPVSSIVAARNAYGMSRRQEEALIARTTDIEEEQVRIAEKSKERLVLLNLALNKNLTDKAVEALFDRDLSYVTKRLESLGYENKSWLERLL